MEYIVALAVLVILVAVGKNLIKPGKAAKEGKEGKKAEYIYSRKEAVMTAMEASFYHRLETVVEGRYYIFPQIHLSALLVNQTKGKYWKAAFQRINRTSVDYVLCDKQTMAPVYAIELDDTSHDTTKRRARDAGVEAMLADVNLPLIRFRNVGSITDDQIAHKFEEAATVS